MKVTINQYEIREAVKQLVIKKLGISEEYAKKIDPEKNIILILEEQSGNGSTLDDFYNRELEDEAYWFEYEQD